MKDFGLEGKASAGKNEELDVKGEDFRLREGMFHPRPHLA